MDCTRWKLQEMFDVELKKQLGDKYDSFIEKYDEAMKEIIDNIGWGSSYPDILDGLSPVSVIKEKPRPKFYNTNSFNFYNPTIGINPRGGVGNVKIVRAYDDEVIYK